MSTTNNINESMSEELSKSIYIDSDIYWFTTNSKFGTIDIGIRRNTIYDKSNSFYKFTILEMVKTLSREEKLIRVVEEWLKTGLNINPRTEEHSSHDYTMTLYSDSKQIDNNHGQIKLAFSEDVLSLLPFPTEIINNNIKVKTSFTGVRLTLSNNRISSRCVESLKPGCILLIPDSFLTPWYLKVIVNNHNADGFFATIEGDISKIYLHNNTLENKNEISEDKIAQETEESYLKIVTDNDIDIPFDIIKGWNQEGEVLLTKPLNNYKISVYKDNLVVATGHLLSITNGYGIFIDTI